MYKTLCLAFCLIVFSGCAYVNECGVSYQYYDGAKYYYDSQGNYVMECPNTNVIDFRRDAGIDYINVDK